MCAKKYRRNAARQSELWYNGTVYWGEARKVWKKMDILRTIAWFIYFFGYMILHKKDLNSGLQALEAGDEARVNELVNRHVPHWCSELLHRAGVSVQVEGRENIPKGVACVFVANHRSYYDIPLMLTCLDGPHALVSKAEVEKIPLVRGWMKLLHCVYEPRRCPCQPAGAESGRRGGKAGPLSEHFPRRHPL